jgi:hypothetical protein
MIERMLAEMRVSRSDEGLSKKDGGHDKGQTGTKEGRNEST